MESGIPQDAWAEFVSMVLGTAVDILPVGIELNVEQDKDNIRLMLVAAWMATGMGLAMFVSLVKYQEEESYSKFKQFFRLSKCFGTGGH